VHISVLRHRTNLDGRTDVLLVCSPGGHAFQLFALREVWEGLSHAWVTAPTSDTLALLRGERVFFAYTPAHRNLRLGVHRIAINWLRNTVLAWRLVRRLRPKVVLTTGAAVAVPFAWIGRLHGSRVVYVESLTRIDAPSLCGRLIAPVADRIYAQWPELVQAFPGGRYAGSVVGAVPRSFAGPSAITAEEDVFVTVGGAEPFDRLVRALEELPADISVLVQRGRSKVQPARAASVDFLSFDELVEHVRSARAVITHAGVGSVLTAWANGKRPIVVPRLHRFSEAVDDHQLVFARRLDRAGLITLVVDPLELSRALAEPLGQAAPSLEEDGRLTAELRSYLETELSLTPS
jgi:beta-1,4-N-acetylglucosaminyltransferase